ncbi:SAM-dependent DNA methyltransferase [Candidatus Woesearchaeota archaeon]|nr:SAM-dependent DNA methyltransferase [Candidatus Woesearchaeota archaeon]
MTQSKLPNWLENKYTVLWDKFKGATFRMEDAEKILQRGDVEKVQGVAVVLSELRKAGWIVVVPDPKDARKSIYHLKSKDDIIKSIFSAETLSRSDIEGILKKAADLIRTRVDYKFILVLLFYKRISDKWELEYQHAYEQALKDGFKEKEAKQEAKNATYHDFVIPEDFLWENIRKEVSKLPEKFSEALKVLADKNQDLKDVLDNMDFIQFTTNRENAEMLRQLVELFSERKLHHVSADVLGDAYEWVLRYFAPDKAKEGEVYTPREVIQLLVEVLDPQPGQSVYDPASASNGMLIISYKHIEQMKGKKEADKLFLFGQEANHKTLAFGRMNLYIHDIKNAKLAFGDTLLYPKFKEPDGVKQFDNVIANPPWNQDGYDEVVLKKGDFWKQRFNYGFVPKQSADWAWIQHMLASSKGKVGIVIDNGCLFRGGKERAIRMLVIDGDARLKSDLIESVILLPEKLFYNTGAPGAIIIFNKNKKHKNGVLFINASSEYEQHPDVRKLNWLSTSNIKKLVDTYKGWKEQTGFSRMVPLDEIRKNDYNLNVSLYVYPEEKTEVIDVMKEWADLKAIEKEEIEVDKKIEGFLKEIT